MTVPPEVVRAFAAPVPRYTSYPTAPHFHGGIGPDTYAGWLESLPAKAKLSLYLHIPFCDTLCWFCGCQTKITRHYKPVAAYLEMLAKETRLVGALVPSDAEVSHIHWGGGSPTMLNPDDIRRLADATRASFRFAETVEFAIEVDPRGLDAPRMDALATAGLGRVSIGVQDFDPTVQQAINRIQSFEETRAAVEGFRGRGVTSLNIDAIYGLPHQTLARLESTLRQVIQLKPDRIALFGYAHVPWMKKHQNMIDEATLGDVVERYRQAEHAAALLVAGGYVRIGIDHFALPHDSLAKAAKAGTLQRNFQGYTVDPTDALIGLGASSISSLPQGYVQNHAATDQYIRKIEAGGLATERGIALSAEDRLRRQIIERLMCALAFSRGDLRSDGLQPEGLQPEGLESDILREARGVIADDVYGFIQETPLGFSITDQGRPFLRAIAARFDAYLPKQKARHSLAV